jgi:hypothetical protein
MGTGFAGLVLPSIVSGLCSNPLVAICETCRRMSSIEGVTPLPRASGRPSTSHRTLGFRIARARFFLVFSEPHPFLKAISAPSRDLEPGDCSCQKLLDGAQRLDRRHVWRSHSPSAPPSCAYPHVKRWATAFSGISDELDAHPHSTQEREEIHGKPERP